MWVMAPLSSTLAWKIPWMEEPVRLQSMGSLQSDTTKQLHFHFLLSCIGEGNGNPLQCSCLENPRDRGAWWADVYGVAQSRTRLQSLSSSSSSMWVILWAIPVGQNQKHSWICWIVCYFWKYWKKKTWLYKLFRNILAYFIQVILVNISLLDFRFMWRHQYCHVKLFILNFILIYASILIYAFNICHY